jgi:hypothetical protein
MAMAAFEQVDAHTLVHEPINPVRACTIGEGILMAEWVAIMNQELAMEDWEWIGKGTLTL